MKGPILYLSEYRVGSPTGPGVNEYEFTQTLNQRFPSKVSYFVHAGSKTDHLPPENVHTFEKPRFSKIGKSLSYTATTVWRIVRTVKKKKIEAIFLIAAPMPVVPWIVTLLFRKKIYLKNVEQYWRPTPSKLWLDKLYLSFHIFFHERLIKRAAAFDATTPELIARASRVNGNPRRALLLPNGVNTDRFLPMDKEKLRESYGFRDIGPILGYAGGYPSDRGAKELVHLVHRLQEEYPNMGAVIAGWDAKLPKIVKLAEELNVSHRCHFLGILPYEKMPEVINLFDIGYALASPEDVTTLSPMKIRQYLSCGLPVVSLKAFPGNDFLDEFGLGKTVESDDLAEIAMKTSALLKEIGTEKHERTARIRRYAVENLSYEKTFDKRLRHCGDHIVSFEGKEP